MGQAGTSFTNAWQNRLLTSDTVAETDIVSLYANYDPSLGTAATDRYLAAREEGDKQPGARSRPVRRGGGADYLSAGSGGLLRGATEQQQYLQHRAGLRRR